jgi:hypothetical protein
MATASFVTSPAGLLVASAAERFSTRPSTLIGSLPPTVALAIDIALAVRLARTEAAAREAARRPGQPWGPIAPGLVYESPEAVMAAELAERARMN